MSLIENVILGLDIALSWSNLFYCFIGVFLGMVVGVLPGIGPLATISMLLPITFHLDPLSAIIMLGGVYYGGSYGGSITSILLNLPGSASAAVACLDGYPMTKQGRGGVALLATTVASFFAAVIGILVMMLFSPWISDMALRFGPAEYFAMMLFGVVAASTISIGSPIKGYAMVVLGLLLGCVGSDLETGVARFAFDIPELYDGLQLAVVAVGIFGIAELIASVKQTDQSGADPKRFRFRSMIPTRDDVRRFWMPMLRGSAIGASLGVLPGVGGTIASFMGYAIEKRVAKDPSRFGRGAIEGVTSPEAANNACDQTAFIPTMTLGIPGSAVMALMLGALIIHGIVPGPNLIAERPDLFWGLVMSFWIGNVMLLVLNLPLIGIWIRLLAVPYHLLLPCILMFVCIGSYSVNNSAFDVYMVAVVGMLGYAMRFLEFPPAPMILGFVLGPMMEENFRRALLISRGNFLVFFERPISASLMVVTLALIAWAIWTAMRNQHQPVQDVAG